MREYSRTWKKPQIYKDIELSEENIDFKEKDIITNLFTPRGAQIEALYALERSREEGFDKALVVAATGIGKTYLAAFDSIKAKRILFVAHREEIINQAAQSFKIVRNSGDIGFFYNNTKDTDKSMIFALVQTLGKSTYLNEEIFPRDYFDYIMIDEFHHAVSNNYKNIINYFTPKFLLGLTATPERLDAKDVFSLCDYNTVYEVNLTDAINKGWLVPFRYYGIYDETVNYESIDYKNGKYNDKKYLNVLDFIGNYKKAGLMPFLLSGKSYTNNKLSRGLPNEEDYPEDCIVDFDFRLVDIFKSLAEKQMTIKQKLKAL